MKTRLKIFTEFVNGLTIAYSETGCTIVCKLKRYVLLDVKYRPWVSPQTRKGFLVKMYIEEILWKANPSKLIQRIHGFELLGRRCMHRDELSVVVDAADMVNPETGEMTKQLTIANHWIKHPFKVYETDVQI